MSNFTKLFGSILTSTIWQESKEVKLLWITLLASCDRWGIVEASLPGLAHNAMLTLAETEEGMKVLSSPDSYSRTKDFEGRRIEAIDGGWQILNYEKYREKASVEERREYNRTKQAESRDRKSKEPTAPRQTLSNNVKAGQSESAMSAHTKAEAKAKAFSLGSAAGLTHQKSEKSDLSFLPGSGSPERSAFFCCAGCLCRGWL
jgi:hypothetical protein